MLKHRLQIFSILCLKIFKSAHEDQQITKFWVKNVIQFVDMELPSY
jgi:hypothetical protein